MWPHGFPLWLLTPQLLSHSPLSSVPGESMHVSPPVAEFGFEPILTMCFLYSSLLAEFFLVI